MSATSIPAKFKTSLRGCKLTCETINESSRGAEGRGEAMGCRLQSLCQAAAGGRRDVCASAMHRAQGSRGKMSLALGEK
jgi:hypothetical protein